MSDGRTPFSAKVDAKVDVENAMRDPDSAKFGSVWTVDHSKGDVTVCGMVNGKNGFGGYSGERPFMVDRNQVILLDGEDASRAYHKRFLRRCG